MLSSYIGVQQAGMTRPVERRNRRAPDVSSRSPRHRRFSRRRYSNKRRTLCLPTIIPRAFHETWFGRACSDMMNKRALARLRKAPIAAAENCYLGRASGHFPISTRIGMAAG